MSNTGNEGGHSDYTAPTPNKIFEVRQAVKQKAPVTVFRSDFMLGREVPEDTKQSVSIEDPTETTHEFSHQPGWVHPGHAC